MAPLRLRIDGKKFRDVKNREVTIRGINCAGDAKQPLRPDLPSHLSEHFFDGDNVSFVGRPFTVDDAHLHFSRLAKWGYNTLRYVFTWEAIEHAGPGKYDEEWISHTIKVLRLAKEYGFYIFLDPHQDVWSRFTGGSGAPMWTLYAMGLNPKTFFDTQAAVVHNTWKPEPADFPKMIWSTNYTRLACQTAFTLFFAGKDFAPKAIIDGKNIQDYLQDHLMGSLKHFAQRLHEAGDIYNEVVIGWESMNEPNRGLVGWPDLSVIPSEQKLQKGTSPTAWQAMLTGSGRACEVDTWDFGGLGPYKSGSELVDPRGVSAWLPAEHDDTKYGWKRDPGWKLGECLWAQHGVWNPSTDRLLRKDYFAKEPNSGRILDYEIFTNSYYMDYYRAHRKTVTTHWKEGILLCQPPVLEIPPSLKGTGDDDPHMVYAPHYYDGITLLTKKWNRYWNVDVFGLLRGRYLSPAFAIKVGETAIRNCLRDQLSAIRKEGEDYMGNHPTIITEIGIPYDMDDKYAYQTGDYTSQTSAMDANHFAIEGCGVNGFTLWVYVANNTHRWGDQWNGEDLSIHSLSDAPLPLQPLSSPSLPFSSTSSTLPLQKSPTTSTTSLNPTHPSFSNSRSSDEHSAPSSPANLKSHLSTPSISDHENTTLQHQRRLSQVGFRAAEAYVRPAPIATYGNVVSYGFDLKNATFVMSVSCAEKGPQPEDVPTEVYLPEFHFPREESGVEGSGGSWEIVSVEEGNGRVGVQRLRWWHGEGEWMLTVKGVKTGMGAAVGRVGEDGEGGYLEQCGQSQCEMM